MPYISGLLHLRIISGRDLGGPKARNKSDPYTTVNIGRTEITRTPVIGNTNLPVWEFDDTVFLKGKTNDNTSLTINVWDKGLMSSPMGELIIPLTKIASAGVLEDNFTLQDPNYEEKSVSSRTTLGSTASIPGPNAHGTLKLRLEYEELKLGVIPEGTRMYDIENFRYAPTEGVGDFYIVRARDLKKMDTVGKSDPFVKVKVGKKTVVKTPVIGNTLLPVWEYKRQVNFKGTFLPDTTINFNVYDKDHMGADKMGGIAFPMSDFLEGKIDGTYPIADLKTKEPAGSLEIHCSFNPSAEMRKDLKTIDCGDMQLKKWKKEGKKKALEGATYVGVAESGETVIPPDTDDAEVDVADAASRSIPPEAARASDRPEPSPLMAAAVGTSVAAVEREDSMRSNQSGDGLERRESKVMRMVNSFSSKDNKFADEFVAPALKQDDDSGEAVPYIAENGGILDDNELGAEAVVSRNVTKADGLGHNFAEDEEEDEARETVPVAAAAVAAVDYSEESPYDDLAAEAGIEEENDTEDREVASEESPYGDLAAEAGVEEENEEEDAYIQESAPVLMASAAADDEEVKDTVSEESPYGELAAEAGVEDELEPEAEPEAETEAETEAEPEAEPEAETEAEPEAEPEEEDQIQAEPESKPPVAPVYQSRALAIAAADEANAEEDEEEAETEDRDMALSAVPPPPGAPAASDDSAEDLTEADAEAEAEPEELPEELADPEVEVTEDKVMNGKHKGKVTDTCFIDDNLLATAGEDGKIVLWNLEKNKPILHFMAHPKEPVAMIQAMPGSTINRAKVMTVGANSRKLKMWEISGKHANLVRTMQLPKTSGDITMAFPVTRKVRTAPEGVPDVADEPRKRREPKVDERSAAGFMDEDNHTVNEQEIGTGPRPKLSYAEPLDSTKARAKAGPAPIEEEPEQEITDEPVAVEQEKEGSDPYADASDEAEERDVGLDPYADAAEDDTADLDEVSDAVDEAVEKGQENLDDTMDSAANAAEETMDNVEETTNNNMGAAEDAMEDTVEDTEEALVNTTEKIEGAMEGAEESDNASEESPYGDLAAEAGVEEEGEEEEEKEQEEEEEEESEEVSTATTSEEEEDDDASEESPYGDLAAEAGVEEEEEKDADSEESPYGDLAAEAGVEEEEEKDADSEESPYGDLAAEAGVEEDNFASEPEKAGNNMDGDDDDDFDDDNLEDRI